jgi:hypothetical protein
LTCPSFSFPRQLASYLDQVALYGTGPTGNQPLGLTEIPGVAQGVAIDPANLHQSFCAVEQQIENADVSMDSYGVIARYAENIAHHAIFPWRKPDHMVRDPRRSKLAGSDRRAVFRRGVEQYDFLFVGSRR